MPPSRRRRLTQRQQQILDFVTTSIRERGYPPTVREIADTFGIRSPNGVHAHLKSLEKKGYLTRDPKKSRGLRPTGEFPAPLVVPMVRSEQPAEVAQPEAAPGRVTLDRAMVGPSAPQLVLRVGPEVRRCPGVEVGDYLLLRASRHPLPGDLVVRREGTTVVVERATAAATPEPGPGDVLGVVQGFFRKV